MATHANSHKWRCRAGQRCKPGRAFSPARLGQRLRGEWLAPFNITGCCMKCQQSRAERAWCRHRFAPLRVHATPVMSCAPALLLQVRVRLRRKGRSQLRWRASIHVCAPAHPGGQAGRVARPPPEGAPSTRPVVIPVWAAVVALNSLHGAARRARKPGAGTRTPSLLKARVQRRCQPVKAAARRVHAVACGQP